MAGIYDFEVKTIDGRSIRLDEYRGKTLLIVNVASQCGYTPQYAGLERLYRKYRAAGLVVLGFPCNQFGAQEPGSEDEIASFCASTFRLTFPLFAKINVNGDDAHPLFKFLKSKKRGLLGTERIKWNFTKFLVDSTGEVVGRFSPAETPAEMEQAVSEAIGGARRSPAPESAG